MGFDNIPQNSHFTKEVEVCICTYLTYIRKPTWRTLLLALRRAQDLTYIRKPTWRTLHLDPRPNPDKKTDLAHPLLDPRPNPDKKTNLAHPTLRPQT